MTTTQRKMLFILIVGIAAEICTLALWKYYDERVSFVSTMVFSIIALSSSADVMLGPNSPQRNTVIILLIVLIAPVCLIAKEYIILFTTPSEFSVEFSSRHLTMFNFDSPTTYAEIAALYIPLGATFTALIALYNESIIPYTPNEPTTVCPCCGKAISKYDGFCPYCHTLSPEVRKSIEAFPNKKFLDFVVNVDNRHLRCPHCSNFLTAFTPNDPSDNWRYREKKIYFSLPGTPIRACFACQHFILDPTYREWVFLSKFQRAKLLFTPDLSLLTCITCVSAIAAEYLCIEIAIVGCIVSLALSIMWKQICTQDIIEASKLRVQNNPDYPKILKHMGYEDSLNQKLP